MAKRMANMHQGTKDETILSVCRRKVEEKDYNHTECRCDANWTRKDKSLPPLFQDK